MPQIVPIGKECVVDCPHLDRLSSWFVVLPDCSASEAMANALCERSPNVLRHPSGRMWMLGNWAESATVSVTCGDVTIAVTGEHSVSEERLFRLAEKVRT